VRVLITGGMGVMGAEATRRFIREGHRPVVYARHRDESLVSDLLDKMDVELGDVMDMPRLLDTIKKHKITHIVHTAAFVGAVSAANPALSVQVNVMGMVNILEAARLFDIERVVYTSAKGIYGPMLGEYGHPTYKPVDEDIPKNPKRIYDSAKLMGEHAGIYYATNLGLDVIVLRFATTYGPGKTARHGNMGITSQLVEAPFFGRPFRLDQGGEQRDDFIYNKDSAAGIYLATVKTGLQSRVFNIGSGVGSTLLDMAAAVRRHIPGADIEIGPGLDFLKGPYPMCSVYDIARARHELGFAPAYDIEAGVADYVDSLKRMKN
jgi:UDP-glucose 4-epimerase